MALLSQSDPIFLTRDLLGRQQVLRVQVRRHAVAVPDLSQGGHDDKDVRLSVTHLEGKVVDPVEIEVVASVAERDREVDEHFLKVLAEVDGGGQDGVVGPQGLHGGVEQGEVTG